MVPSNVNVAGSVPLRVFRVPSGSMEPDYPLGAGVTVTPGSLAVGDVVIFHPPKGSIEQVCGPTPHVIRLGGAACAEPEKEPSSTSFIKRVVAGPGDQIYIKEGHVYRRPAGANSFRAESDSYIKPCSGSRECDFPTPITVPAGDWYMLGDNRGESDDSRLYGAIPTGWILGIVRSCIPPALSGPCG